MKIIIKSFFFLLIGLLTKSYGQTVFEESNGSLTIPAENLALVGSWQVQTFVTGFNGNGYIVWTGTDSFTTQTAIGTITTQIKINTPGTYLVKWRNKVGQGTSSTDFNDSWLKFSDATDFYAQKTGSAKTYAKGSGKTPNPAGAGTNGFFKVYLNGTINWTDRAFTSDNDPHSIYVEFAAAGIYTMLISARSRLHLIDEIYLTLQSSLSINDNVLNTSKVLYLYPNPIEKDSVLQVATTAEEQKIVITDISGKVVLTKEVSGTSNAQVQLKGLQSGTYIVKVRNEASKFIIK